MDTLPFAAIDSFLEETVFASPLDRMEGKPSTSTAVSKGPALTQRGRFKRPAKSNGITHGYIPGDIADRIFRDALQEWGMSSSSEGTREDVLGGLAEVLWASTSAETDYSAVMFEVEGSYLSVQPLINVATRHISVDNPLRVWIRSFRNAEMALRIHDFLDTPENLVQRQEAAASYGAELRDARFCFDMGDALLITGREFSTSERNLIASLRIYATSRAQGNAQARGMIQPTHDSSGGKVGGAPTAGGVNGGLSSVNPAPSSVRSGFAPIR